MILPKVSIVIATYNSGDTIEKTIQSFIGQDYPNKELVVIDGGSSDESLEIINKYKKAITYFVSEKDKGISDAFNKGVTAATGDYINFQGAGDIFLSDDVISEMMKNVNKEEDLLVCGRIKRVDADGKLLFESSTNFSRYLLLYKMALPHQALFTNKRFFEKYGSFDPNCRYAMDYELLLRAYHDFPNAIMKDVFVSAWQGGGIGTGKTREVLCEYDQIRRKNKIAPSWILSLIFWLSLMKAGV